MEQSKLINIKENLIQENTDLNNKINNLQKKYEKFEADFNKTNELNESISDRTNIR